MTTSCPTGSASELAAERGRGQPIAGAWRTPRGEAPSCALQQELLGLVKTHASVRHGLVVSEKFLQRRGEGLVGRKDGNKGAERQPSLDHEVATDRIEEEGRQLRAEVVQALHEELLSVDFEANRSKPTQRTKSEEHTS